MGVAHHAQEGPSFSRSVHFFQIENLGVDFDHTSVGEKRNFFDLVSCPGFGA
jgi:hypothetical protein